MKTLFTCRDGPWRGYGLMMQGSNTLPVKFTSAGTQYVGRYVGGNWESM